MNFLALLERYAPGRWPRCLLAATAGGFLAAAVVMVVNAATASDRHLASWALGLAFLAVLAVMYVSQRLAARYLVAAFEDVQRGLRDDLSARLLAAPLRAVERLEHRLGQASGELAYLSGAVDHWAGGMQHMAFLGSVTLMVAAISLKALLVWTIAFAATVAYVRPRLASVKTASHALGRETGALSEQVELLLDGFVQVKLDGQIAAGITEDTLRAADSLYREQWSIRRFSVVSMTGAVLLLYLLSWGPAAFADPDGVGLAATPGYELVTLIELSLGPLFGLLGALPEWARAEAAARGIAETIDSLAAEPGVGDGEADEPDPAFETIALAAARFAYTEDGASFEVGPIDLTIRRGELTFLTGGNGSGKTTLMKMLLGLYPLDGGRLTVDGRTVGDLVGHRNRFTAIFSHQHLFSRLHGLEASVSREQVEALLVRFGISEMIRYGEKDGFGRIALSTGQRMRLAMVVALLEDRPICVFDEWTANQDPETTWFYYETLLPELIAAGKTVIAVSHDDRFFDRADHFVAMADGRIVEERRREPPR